MIRKVGTIMWSILHKPLFPRLFCRGVMKWFGVAFCLLCLTLWWISTRSPFGYLWFHSGFVLRAGGLELLLGPYPWGAGFIGAPGPEPTQWLPDWGPVTGTQLCYLRIPLWMPFLAVAIPTGLSFWRHRRPPEGHCQKCGYDLTSNVSGVCPECGARL